MFISRLLLFPLLAVAACSRPSDLPRKPNQEVSRPAQIVPSGPVSTKLGGPPVASLEASELALVSESATKAEKLLGKVVEVRGKLLEVKNEGAVFTLRFRDPAVPEGNTVLAKVICNFESDNEVKNLSPGQEVRILGEAYLSDDGDFILEYCQLKKEEPAEKK